MVDVVRGNFSSLLPRVEECIRRCDFVAVDTEFTGLHVTPQDEVSLFDSMEERYEKLKKFAEKFIICQFGLSTFTKDTQDNHKYVAHTFNFYVFPREQGTVDRRFSFQASNVDFLCCHKFDFNKLFYEGIHYLNCQQEAEIRGKDGKELDEKEKLEVLGLTRVFRFLERAKKPLLGHNMLSDLALIYQNFYEPLPDSYCQFKARLHQIFPVVLDTKNLCFAVQRRLSQTKLLEFTSLTDLCEALGSQRGTLYVLYAPEITHSEDCQKYNFQRIFHEAGYDAFCVGFVFLRIAHLLAMKDVKSSDAHSVHVRQYFRITEPYVNRINLIRGPINYIDLQGKDPPYVRSDWLVVSTRDNSDLTMAVRLAYNQLQEQLHSVMDVRRLSPHSALVVLSSRKRAESLMAELKTDKLHMRRYWRTDSPLAKRLIGLGALSVGVIAAAGVIWLLRTKH